MSSMMGRGKGPQGFAPKGTLKRLLTELFAKYKWQLIICMVCLAVNAGTNFSASIFIKNYIFKIWIINRN